MAQWNIWRRPQGAGDDAWFMTGEVFVDGVTPDLTNRDQPADRTAFLAARSADDGWEYKAEPRL